MNDPHARIRSLPPEGALSGFGRPGATDVNDPHARIRSLPPEGGPQWLRAAERH